MRSYRTILKEIDNLNRITNKDSNVYGNINRYQKDLYDLRRHIRYLIYLSRSEGLNFPEDKFLILIKGYNNE